MELQACRICNGETFTEVVNLGNQVITSRFPNLGDAPPPSGMIRLVMCDSCQLVQLKDSTPASEMYEHFYGYRSGINATMRNHLTSFNEELQKKVVLNPGDSVLDIGSNDCTFVGHYPDVVKRHGCDPTGVQFTEFYTATNTTLVPTYFTKAACEEALGEGIRFKAVTSISMFYDLPDPIQFAKDIYALLDTDGVWGLEQSYSATMLERNSIDTICHEHLEYYGVRQIKHIMDNAGFKIIDILLNECNGGSFRIYVAKRESQNHTENTALIDEFLQKEEVAGIHTPERYHKFMKDCTTEVNRLVEFISLANADGKKVYIYGASTKGNCLLQFANLDSTLIPYAVERNPLKVGRTTSTGIEIISEETMRMNPPQFMLVLPWHFRTEIIQREIEFLNNGGQFIFPFPQVEIYSNRPKTFITGIDGQIGSYVEELLSTQASIYGAVTRSTKQTSTLRIHTNLLNNDTLEKLILTIKPDRIIHLASISNTDACEQNPILTIDLNGRLAAVLCDILSRNKLPCKLFNASSSENYKGHIDYVVTDNDIAFRPTTLYGYCKTMSHQIISSYREKLQLPFSNGIIFMTESPYRSAEFLLKKVALHAKSYRTELKPLVLGNLGSWRNINHAKDVAHAIVLILDQECGDDYVMCGSNVEQVEHLVIGLYKRFNIQLIAKENGLYDINTGDLVVHINSLPSVNTKINGYAEKLYRLGWKPDFTTDMILDDLLL